MLLKLRKGHVLPDADNPTSSNFNDDIEKTLFEISRNEESFISSCQLYFKFVKPKKIQLRNGNKAYYIPIQEKKYISQFNGQDILYHYRNSEIDDVGVVNPLMGKNATHKLTTFYFSIDDLPTCNNSSVNAVYLLLLYYRKDFEDENNRQLIFRQLKICADNLAGANDRRNHPPVLKEKDIFDKRIPGKAMEKYCLFLNLPFMLISFIDKVPYWFLYTLLRQIWDILYSDYPRRSWLSTLEELIEEF
ncbi:unnamed protein product, partial [Rotaria sp. Silwood1]